jgi:hypothetical protein
MIRAEDIKKEIDVLPPSMLVQLDMFIRHLKKNAKESAAAETILMELSEYAFDDDLPPDLSEQHDFYLYGVSRK